MPARAGAGDSRKYALPSATSRTAPPTPGIDIVAHQLPRPDRHADAGRRGLQAEIEMLEGLRRRAAASGAPPPRPLRPGIGTGGAVQQHRALAQSRAAAGAIDPRIAIGRTAHRPHPLVEQMLRVHLAAPGKIVAADRQVDLAEPDRAAAGHPLQGDLRMRGLERRQPRNQPAHQQGGFARQHQRRLARRLAQFAHGRREQVERGGRGVAQALAGRGQVHALAAPLEQRHAKRVLDRAHRPAERAVGQVQLLRGAGEAAQARGRFEAAQRAQRRQRGQGAARGRRLRSW
nr:hypothetical protein [Lysobacter enzymogenes]